MEAATASRTHAVSSTKTTRRARISPAPPQAFGDPTRLRIMQLLGTAEMSVGELVAASGQSQPKISNHLSCLRWCGCVVSRREHRCVYYTIADARVVQMLELAGALLEQNAEHVACCRVIDQRSR